MDEKRYYRIMPGRKSAYADECLKGGFIGADFSIKMDLSKQNAGDWREFNKKMIPVYLKEHPEKSKVAAGLACGALYTISKGINNGDMILSPDGSGSYMVGEVADNYSYHPGEILPHRRKVRWYPKTINRSSMSESLQFSTGAIGTISDVTKYAEEIELLLKGNRPPSIIAGDETIENPYIFALEKHLEDFMVQNWDQTELGKLYDVFEEDGEKVGRQYPTDTGPIDILAVSKDKKTLLVVELKKGRASDSVVGQVQSYMGYVQEELAEDNQQVKGIIIALEEDKRLKNALKVTRNIEFYRYQVSFKLFKA